MKIYLHLFSILRENLPPEAKGRSTIFVEEGTTLDNVLMKLGIERRVVMSVNGIHELNRSRQLKDGDKVSFFSSISGG